jgi:hypothetical protein
MADQTGDLPVLSGDMRYISPLSEIAPLLRVNGIWA